MKLNPPNEDEQLWPLGVSSKGLTANTTIYCPELSWWTPLPAVCYGCEIGYNGKCEALTNKILEQPKILTEIYKPIPELRKLPLKKSVVFYQGKFYNEKDAHKLKDKNDIYLVDNKYRLILRFIPKYEDVGHSLSKKLFVKKLRKVPFKFAEIVDHCQSGDELFVVHKDKKIQELLEIMEKFNGK